MTLTSVNPATGETLATYTQDSDADLDRKLNAAGQAAAAWRETSWADRTRALRQVATGLRQGAGEHARLMAGEMGKPVTQGTAEIEKCAWTCEFFADHAEDLLRPEEINSEARRSFVCFPPLGVVLAIMPWNFPFWQVIRCAVPALLAGNTVVLKHAANVSGCALALADAFQSAGLPSGAFQVALTDSRRVAALIQHRAVRAVALTGSVAAGRAVASLAGAALKKTVLELGGSDPYVVLPDADPIQAARLGAQARLVNSGQSCIAAKRFIVTPSVRHAFEEQLTQELRQAVVGDPLDPATMVGPLARTDLRDELHSQVVRTQQAGARLVLGGRLPDGRGAFYPPTLLTNVRPGMPAFDEETFGPVAPVTAARDEGEAWRLANTSDFGLGAAVFTANSERGAQWAATALEAGACFVNTFVRSDPRLPFGGIKDSGYGRELGAFGIREFVNIKTVYVG